MQGEEFSRRDFLKSVAALSSVVGASSLAPWTDAAEDVDPDATYIEEETIKAFADTVVPGPTSDPEGSVGGVEADALELLYDPGFGLEPFMGIIAKDLNQTSLKLHSRLFKDLDLSQRIEIVLSKDNDSGIKQIYLLAESVVKLAFYGAVVNDVGTDYISFPGPSSGYNDYSFNEKFAEEATEDGNLP